MDRRELIAALSDPNATQALCRQADQVRRREMGDVVHLRAIVEFSNYCRNDCRYCGIRFQNARTRRYRMAWDDVLASAQRAADEGFRTVVLQSGEDPQLDVDGLAATITEIKKRFGMAVTLSCGEWPREVYRRWKEAGADRYLIKLESADPEFYAALHPSMRYTERRRCLDDLFALDYEVGSGNIIGLPGQTAEHLAADIEDFASVPYDMIAVGPLIPANETPFADAPQPPIDLVYRVLALTRLHAPTAHIPSTTAMCAVDPIARKQALRAGANVVMINFTPPDVAPDYQIYERAACGSTQSCIRCIKDALVELGLRIGDDVGAGIRRKGSEHAT